MTKTKNSIYKIILIVVASSISALGTVPYGYRFGLLFENYNHSLGVGMGVVFAIAAGGANIALGTYSLLSLDLKQKEIHPLYLITGSVLSAVPLGFMCYFAYVNTLPFVLNFITSLIATAVNAAIAYTAVLNLILEVKEKLAARLSVAEISARLSGFFMGLIVSITAYMVAIHGMYGIFNGAKWHIPYPFQIACLLGFITWLPYAALFSNSTQIMASNVYYFLTHAKTQLKKASFMNILLLLFAIFSATSFTQIAMDFFDPSMDIPQFFKLIPIQAFIYKCLVPLAFFSSMAVNYMALEHLHQAKTRRL